MISYFLWPTPLVSHGAQRRWLHELVELSRWRGVVRAGL